MKRRFAAVALRGNRINPEQEFSARKDVRPELAAITGRSPNIRETIAPGGIGRTNSGVGQVERSSHSAIPKHGDPVADGQCFLEFVGNEHDRHPTAP